MDNYFDVQRSEAIDVHYMTTTVAMEAKRENSPSIYTLELSPALIIFLAPQILHITYH